MQNYQATPNYYRDYIEHGWLKDQAAKTHKYIKKYVNKAGNTIYVYARKAQTTINRKLRGVPDASVSYNYGAKRFVTISPWGSKSYWDAYKKGTNTHTSRSGYAGQQKYSLKDTTKGIGAGRKRAAGKGYKIKGYSGNLTSKGYPSGEGLHWKYSGKAIGTTLKEGKVYPSSNSRVYGGVNGTNSGLKEKSKRAKTINAGRRRVRAKKGTNLRARGYASSR